MRAVTVYLTSDHGLVAVDRAAPEPVTLRAVLRLLTQGPTFAEQRRGLQSPIATVGGAALRSTTGTTAAVDVPRSFTSLGGQDQIFAAAQLVYTLTGFPGIHGVTVWVAGQRASVPSADGSLLAGPLTRTDYASLAPV